MRYAAAVSGRFSVRQLIARLTPDRWGAATLAVALFVATPLIAVASIALTPAPDIWRHLYDTVLFGYIERTLILIAGLGLGTFILGTGTAWLVTMCRFPGRGLFNWALVLPLAVPTYILAFVFTDQLEYAGNLQVAATTGSRRSAPWAGRSR